MVDLGISSAAPFVLQLKTVLTFASLLVAEGTTFGFLRGLSGGRWFVADHLPLVLVFRLHKLVTLGCRIVRIIFNTDKVSPIFRINILRESAHNFRKK